MSDNRKAWTADEDHAITTLVKKHGTHHWSQISKRMYDHFGPPGRTGKQCRQRWHNHLNPKINKSPWSSQEEQQLFRYHSKYGNKWKSIAQHFKGRTDNDIKNKFYSTMRKKLRKINKMLGIKNSTTQVKQIKPKVLSNIIAAASTDNEKVQQAWQELSKVLFCQDDRKLSKLVKGEDRSKIQQLIQKINVVNQTYLESKEKQKSMSKNQMQATVQYRNSNQQIQQQKNDTSELRRITLRRRPTTNNAKKQSTQSKEKSEKQNLVEQQNNFNFNINLGDSCFSPTPVFFSNLCSFTPTMNKKRSMMSNQSDNQSSLQWRDQFINSPRMLTRSFIRTPNVPTPGACAGAFDFKFNAYDLGSKQSYNELVTDVQNRINRQTLARI